MVVVGKLKLTSIIGKNFPTLVTKTGQTSCVAFLQFVRNDLMTSLLPVMGQFSVLKMAAARAAETSTANEDFNYRRKFEIVTKIIVLIVPPNFLFFLIALRIWC